MCKEWGFNKKMKSPENIKNVRQLDLINDFDIKQVKGWILRN